MLCSPVGARKVLCERIQEVLQDVKCACGMSGSWQHERYYDTLNTLWSMNIGIIKHQLNTHAVLAKSHKWIQYFTVQDPKKS